MNIDGEEFEEETVAGSDAVRTIQALNDQARDILVFPAMAVNLLADPTSISLAIEFQRIPGAALDATVVQLTWQQARRLSIFLRTHLNAKTETDEIRRLFPTNERENRDDAEA